jgi:hypothetical protein
VDGARRRARELLIDDRAHERLEVRPVARAQPRRADVRQQPRHHRVALGELARGGGVGHHRRTVPRAPATVADVSTTVETCPR